ncbi:MAG: TetR family transcriptional regulator [Rhodospirillales bacterium]|nr:TetR family transcriptional regulator [Rhodospirillales bacterium]
MKTDNAAQTEKTDRRVGWKQAPDDVRANILDTAQKEFAENGFSGARVDAIAARTKTSKRMLYYYFGNKEQLYLEVLRASYQEVRTAEQSLNLETLAPDDAMRQIVRFTVNHHVANPDFIRLVMIENIHHGRFIRQLNEIQELNAGAIRSLEKIYKAGCAAGLFRKDIKPIDIHWLISALAFFSVSNQATFGWLFEKYLTGARADLADSLGEDIVLRFLANHG